MFSGTYHKRHPPTRVDSVTMFLPSSGPRHQSWMTSGSLISIAIPLYILCSIALFFHLGCIALTGILSDKYKGSVIYAIIGPSLVSTIIAVIHERLMSLALRQQAARFAEGMITQPKIQFRINEFTSTVNLVTQLRNEPSSISHISSSCYPFIDQADAVWVQPRYQLLACIVIRCTRAGSKQLEFSNTCYHHIQKREGFILSAGVKQVEGFWKLNTIEDSVAVCLCAKEILEYFGWRSDIQIGISVGCCVISEVKVTRSNIISVEGIAWDSAHQLCLLNEKLGTTLLTSSELYPVAKHYFECRPVDYVKFGGTDAPTAVYQLVQMNALGDNGLFSSSSEALFQGDWQLFRKLLVSARRTELSAMWYSSHVSVFIKHWVMSSPTNVLPPYARQWLNWEDTAVQGSSNTLLPSYGAAQRLRQMLEGPDELVYYGDFVSHSQSKLSFQSSDHHDFTSDCKSPPVAVDVNAMFDVIVNPLVPPRPLQIPNDYTQKTENCSLAGVGVDIMEPDTILQINNEVEEASKNSSPSSKRIKAIRQISVESFEETEHSVLTAVPTPAMTQLTDSSGKVWVISQRQLGQGSYGNVFLAMDDSGCMAAVKQVQIRNNSNSLPSDIADDILNEISLLSRIRHRNIVGYMGSALEGPYLIVIMEYVAGGSLATSLRDFGALPISIASCYTLDIVKGLAYLHRNDVIHRDIKPANVLVQPSGMCKLADFGTAKANTAKEFAGTIWYMSPEALRGDCSKENDIWSLGITVFQLLTNRLPIQESLIDAGVAHYAYHVAMKGLILEDFSTLPNDAVAFLSLCTDLDPTKRPNARDLINTSFLRSSSIIERSGSICQNRDDYPSRNRMSIDYHTLSQ